MAKKNTKQTTPPIATKASNNLRNKNTPKDQKEIDGSDLAQANRARDLAAKKKQAKKK